MNAYQKAHYIERLPNLLEFMGFVYFMPTFLAGPCIEIRDYLAFADRSLFKVL
jgi:lysophospholipid acyltransferase